MYEQGESDIRRFTLNRLEDESGISGTGTVCEGVAFSDGSVALRWLSDLSSHVIYKSIEDVIAIHGHDGKTILEWLDVAPEISDRKHHENLNTNPEGLYY